MMTTFQDLSSRLVSAFTGRFGGGGNNHDPQPDTHPLAHSGLPFQTLDFAAKGCHLETTVAPSQVVDAATIMDQHGFALDTITGLDWIATNEMEVVYDFFHPLQPFRVAIRTRVPRENPELPTIMGVFPGADWHERETHDFFGIRFAGNPNLTPFLLPEDADYHPLRKDFAAA
jgi:NADH-quinone oxidoreductase subunit C